MREVAVRAGKARLAHRQIQRQQQQRSPCCRTRRQYSTSSSSNTIQAAPPSSASTSSTISASPSSTSSSSASSSASSPTSATSIGSNPPKKPAPSAVQRRQRTDLALIVTGTLGLAGLGLYTLKPAPSGPGSATHSQNLSSLSPISKSFTLPVRTQSGTQDRTITMYSPAKVSEILTANERSYSISRPGNPLYRYDTNSVASNDPCEDTQAFTILEHEGKDFILASVFDGHSGFHTSRLLAEVLEKYIARELFEVLKGNYRSLRITNESWWNWLWHKSKEGPKMPVAQAADSEGNGAIAIDERIVMIPEALRTAYKLADRDIVQSPVDYMRSLDPTPTATGSPSSSSNVTKPNITEEQRLRGVSLLNPALSGACSLSTLIDTSSPSPSVYVAIAGDSRAVMGTYDAESGKWIASVLSQDQTGKNPKEVQRMRAEHPKSEEETVIMRGRVLGGLEPTRSLGDAKYKWPVGVQQQLVQLFRPTSARMANPSLYKTPPYVTANPEVGVYSLGGPASSSADTESATSALTKDSGDSLVAASAPASPKQGPVKQFIVMATDGLYDCLSSEEVVALVGAHLSGQKSTQTKQELLSVLGTSSGSLAGSVSPHKPRPPPTGGPKGDDATVKRYVFEDSNLSTHLTRNALGGALKEQVSALLSIPAPQCRRYRDDITITVLLFDSEASQREAEVKVSEKSELLQGVRRIWEGKERSKL